MAKGGVTLDTVMINIESDAGKATSNIDNLAKSLETLKSSIKGGFNNINKLASALTKLNKSSAGLKQTAKSIDSVSKISGALKSLDNIANPKGLNSAVKSLEKLPQVINKIDGKTIKNVTRVSNELAAALSPLATKLSGIGQGFSAISQLANKYGVSVTKVKNDSKEASSGASKLQRALSALSGPFKKVSSASNSFSKSAIRGFKKVNSSIKQIGLSLLGTRTIFTATRKAISEYMNMDQELSKSVTNLWRALGAQLAPAVEGVLYLFKQFVRVVYSVVKAITGIDLIARANAKATASWGKSAKDALGSLQKFDDLNVVEFPKNEGDDKLIELDEIDLSPIQKIIDLIKKLVKKINKAFKTGLWEGVGKAFADVVNEAFDMINVIKITKVLKDVANNFTEFLNGAIKNIKWSLIGKKTGGLYKAVLKAFNSAVKNLEWDSIGKGITDFIVGLDLMSIVDDITQLVGNITIGLSTALNNINLSTLTKNISNAFTKGLNNLSAAINYINFSQLGVNIRDAILSVDWAGVFNSILDIAKSILGGIGEFLDGVFDTNAFTQLTTSVNNVVDAIANIGATILKTLGKGTAAGAILDLVETIVGNIASMANTASQIISEWAISPEFEQVISDIDTTIASIAEWLGTLTDKWTEWYNSDGASSFKDILITLTDIANTLLPVISELLSEIMTILTPLFEWVLLPALTVTLDHINRILQILKVLLDFVTTDFTPDIVDAIKGMLNKDEQAVKDSLNRIIDKLNKIIADINKVFSIKISTFQIKLWDLMGVNHGYTAGQRVNMFTIPSIPKLEVGTNNVPYDDMLAVLHKGEAVVPKKYNPAAGGGNSQEMLDRFDRLIFLMENQEQTTNVYVGNKKLYQEQKKYDKRQYNKYGTLAI